MVRRRCGHAGRRGRRRRSARRTPRRCCRRSAHRSQGSRRGRRPRTGSRRSAHRAGPDRPAARRLRRRRGARRTPADPPGSRRRRSVTVYWSISMSISASVRRDLGAVVRRRLCRREPVALGARRARSSGSRRCPSGARPRRRSSAGSARTRRRPGTGPDRWPRCRSPLGVGGVEKTNSGRSPRRRAIASWRRRARARSASRQYSVRKIRSVSPVFSITWRLERLEQRRPSRMPPGGAGRRRRPRRSHRGSRTPRSRRAGGRRIGAPERRAPRPASTPTFSTGAHLDSEGVVQRGGVVGADDHVRLHEDEGDEVRTRPAACAAIAGASR